LNVVPTVGGKVLASITDGGMAYLLAGARANAAVKSGRYMYEAKIVQSGDYSKGVGTQLRIGVSLGEYGLVMGGNAMSCAYFDSDGTFAAEKKRINIKNGAMKKDQVVAVVLNLESNSPNSNTIALYRDGVAVGDPQPLPEELKGKPLFPHVCFRNATVQVNFGSEPLKALPFKCRLIQGAAASDVSVAATKTPQDGKYEILMPVAFPDEGTFDWLDEYLSKNPKYVELSDRKIVEWARLSGLKSQGKWNKSSNDKPSVNFGIPELDNMSIRRVVSAVAPVMPRNYCIMEVKSNLVAAERKEILKKFNYPCYKKVAKVIMGEPGKEFKTMVQSKLLKEKQAKADASWKQKKIEAAKKKEQAKKQKEAEKRKKEAEAKRKAAAEAKKKEEEEKKKQKEEKKDSEDKKDGEDKTEEKPAEEKKEEAPAPMEEDEEEKEEEEEEKEPPKVELTEEELKLNFMKKNTPDIAPQVLNSAYAKFTTPEQDEGFDDIQYEWFKGDKAQQYLKQWVLNKKLTTRMEDIRPGELFKKKLAEFNKLSKEWQDKLKAHKASGKKKPAKKEGDEPADDVDIFSVTDINDVGGGVPLFEHFGWEDWELVQLRSELCLMAVCFKKDANDEDRTGIPMDHVGFYYNRYYNKQLNVKRYGLATFDELVNMIKDTVATKDSLLVSVHSEELDGFDIFVKLAEEHRRERQRRIDAGDETARLKFQQPTEPKQVAETKTAAKPADKPAEKGGKGKGKDGKGKEAAAAPKVVAGYGAKGKDGKGKDAGKGQESKGWGKGKNKW